MLSIRSRLKCSEDPIAELSGLGFHDTDGTIVPVPSNVPSDVDPYYHWNNQWALERNCSGRLWVYSLSKSSNVYLLHKRPDYYCSCHSEGNVMRPEGLLVFLGSP